MSKHQVQPQTNVLHDIECMSDEELQDKYGIEIYEDGVVYDPFEEAEFDDITEWANYTADLEEDDNYAQPIKINGKQRFDDDRF